MSQTIEAGTVEVVPPEEQVFRFMDGGEFRGWECGWLAVDLIERVGHQIKVRCSSSPDDVIAAQQRVLTMSASALNRACGVDPSDALLKAAHDALIDLINRVVTHPNYRW